MSAPEGDEVREWVRVQHSPGKTTVYVTLLQGNQSVKWGVKSYPGHIKQSVIEARAAANEALTQLQEATS